MIPVHGCIRFSDWVNDLFNPEKKDKYLTSFIISQQESLMKKPCM